MDQADRGSITVGGIDITALSEGELAAWRAAHVGFVFQFYNLIPVLTALENVELPLAADGPVPARAPRARAHGAAAGRARGPHGPLRRASSPAGSSSGWPSRARSSADPTLIVADEPTGDLDRVSAEEVLVLMERLCRELGKTIIMVTHDPRAARRAARIKHLDKGVLTDDLEAPLPECV